MTQTIVAIGCSQVQDYSFLIPLSALLWKRHIGFQPIIFLIGNENDWDTGRNKIVISALNTLEIKYKFVSFIDGYSEGTVAQNIRQHAAADKKIDDDTWIMMSDADLWPIRREFYHQHEGYTGRAVCLYSNGDHFFGKKDVLSKFDAGGGFQSIPTCHVTMRAKDWRIAYEIDAVDDERAALLKTLKKMEPWLMSCADINLARWCCDQWYITERLCRQPWFPDAAPPHPCPPGGRILSSENVLLVERYGHPPVDRLDRTVDPWTQYGSFDLSRLTDAHVHRSPFSKEHWADEFRVLSAILPKHETWMKSYYEEYTR